MKRLFLLTLPFVLLLANSKAHAQHAYIPIPEDSTFWISVEEDWGESEPRHGHTYKYIVYYTDGKDTIVDGKRYFGYYGQIPPEDLYGKVSISQEDWFRQDTVTKKVWRVLSKPWEHGDLKEELFYDFSLQKGDTITDTTQGEFHRWLPYKFWVADVDSIYFPDNTWRCRWFIESNFGPDWGSPPAEVVQIEGMGYTTDFRHDPLYRYEPMVGYTYEITCFRHKSLWLYTAPNPWNADCDSLMDHNVADVGIHSPPANELNLPLLYPNPAISGGILTLNSFAGRTWEQHTVTAYNSFGKLVLKKQLKPGQSFALPYFSSGLYFFTVKDSGQKIICTQKINIR